MTNFPNHKNRRSIRLQGYDYSQEGAYYVTICVQDRLCLFGEVRDNEMVLNEKGLMVEAEWLNLKNRFPNINLHEYVVMPNHFHGILEIVNDGQPCDIGQSRGKGQPSRPVGTPTVDHKYVGVPLVGTQNENKKTVGDMMDAFKSITTVEYIRGVKTSNWTPFRGKLWQRNYYEHIIRDGNDYERITKYIQDNPANWRGDDLFM